MKASGVWSIVSDVLAKLLITVFVALLGVGVVKLIETPQERKVFFAAGSCVRVEMGNQYHYPIVKISGMGKSDRKYMPFMERIEKAQVRGNKLLLVGGKQAMSLQICNDEKEAALSMNFMISADSHEVELSPTGAHLVHMRMDYDNWISLLDATTGQVVWEERFGVAVTPQTFFDVKGSLYLYNSTLWSLRVITPDENGNVSQEKFSVKQLYVKDGMLFRRSGDTLVGYDKDGALLIDLKTGVSKYLAVAGLDTELGINYSPETGYFACAMTNRYGGNQIYLTNTKINVAPAFYRNRNGKIKVQSFVFVGENAIEIMWSGGPIECKIFK